MTTAMPIGLGQMNLHGYLARERIYYGSRGRHRLHQYLFLHRDLPRHPRLEPHRR